MLIFLVGLATSLNMFIHYSFISNLNKARTFFVIEMLRFSLFFMVCYYFISKASGLLPNKKYIMIILRLVFGITFIFIIAVGFIIFHGVNNYIYGITPGIDFNSLCTNTVFQSFRYFPLVI